MSSQNRTIAFFGATGGTGAAALASALKAGHHSTALIRDPSKLLDILRTQHSISDSTLSTHLTTIAGSAKSVEDVSKALINPHNQGYLVDTIFTSLGSFPKPQFSLRQPLVLVDPTICQDAMATTFAAIDDLASKGIKSTASGKKSALVIVSGTTSTDIWGELPWNYLTGPLYTYLLSSPHQDKMATEALLHGDKGAHLRDFVVVRPSFLTDGKELGRDKLRVGWTWSGEKRSEEKEERGLVGWTVSKRDLGAWIYDKVLGGSEGETLGWEGKVVKVTY